MKNLFYLIFIFCFIVSTINISIYYSRQLEEPFVFELPIIPKSSYYFSIPYLTNNSEPNSITNITIGDLHLSPINYMYFNHNINPQINRQFRSYDLKTAKFDLSSIREYLDKDSYTISITFDDATTVERTLAFHPFETNHKIIESLNGHTDGHELYKATFRVNKDITITKIELFNSPFTGTIMMDSTNIMELTLPFNITKGQLLYLKQDLQYSKYPSVYTNFPYLLLTAQVYETGEVIQHYIQLESKSYDDEYLNHFVKEMKK